jgi:hypothetical protein
MPSDCGWGILEHKARMKTEDMRRLTILALAICIAVGCRSSDDLAKSDSEHEASVASVLYNEFETVVFTRFDKLDPRRILNLRNKVSGENASTLLYPFEYALEALSGQRNGAGDKLLDDSEAVLVGAKDFRLLGGTKEPPHALSTACYVFVFGERKQELHRFLGGNAPQNVDGLPVWSWQAYMNFNGPLDNSPVTIFASTIDDSYLLLSNNLDELKRVAAGLATSGTESQTIKKLPDWPRLSKSEEWAIRRNTGIRSPDNGFSFFETFTNVQALIYSVDLTGGNSMFKIISNDKRDAERFNGLERAQPMASTWPPLRPCGNGAWCGELLLSKDKTVDSLISIIGYFGFPEED